MQRDRRAPPTRTEAASRYITSATDEPSFASIEILPTWAAGATVTGQIEVSNTFGYIDPFDPNHCIVSTFGGTGIQVRASIRRSGNTVWSEYKCNPADSTTTYEVQFPAPTTAGDYTYEVRLTYNGTDELITTETLQITVEGDTDDGSGGDSGDGTDDGSGDGSGDGSDDGTDDGSGDGSDDGSGGGSDDGSGDGTDDGSGSLLGNLNRNEKLLLAGAGGLVLLGLAQQDSGSPRRRR